MQKILIATVVLMFVTVSLTQGEPSRVKQSSTGFNRDIRDSLGPSTSNTYSIYTVEKSIDNHSVLLSTGSEVRYIGVGDFKQSKMSSSEAEKAYQFNRGLTFTNIVRLEFDEHSRTSDGHLQAYVFLHSVPHTEAKELFVNAELIRQGHTRYVPNRDHTRYHEYFKELQKEAILEKRGMWKTKSFMTSIMAGEGYE
jgi:endonuclease YncB( thermonuclease family)